MESRVPPRHTALMVILTMRRILISTVRIASVVRVMLYDKRLGKDEGRLPLVLVTRLENGYVAFLMRPASSNLVLPASLCSSGVERHSEEVSVVSSILTVGTSPVSSVDRVSGREPEGREFKSHTGHHALVTQLDRVAVF